MVWTSKVTRAKSWWGKMGEYSTCKRLACSLKCCGIIQKNNNLQSSLDSADKLNPRQLKACFHLLLRLQLSFRKLFLITFPGCKEKYIRSIHSPNRIVSCKLLRKVSRVQWVCTWGMRECLGHPLGKCMGRDGCNPSRAPHWGKFEGYPHSWKHFQLWAPHYGTPLPRTPARPCHCWHSG